MHSSVRLSALLFTIVVPCSAVACGSTSNNVQRDLGDVTAGSYTVHILQEGEFLPSTTTKYAIKPTGTTPKPDSVSCWFGAQTADASTHVTATYDPNDADFDCLVAAPATVAAGDLLWFNLVYGTQTATGSVATQAQ